MCWCAPGLIDLVLFNTLPLPEVDLLNPKWKAQILPIGEEKVLLILLGSVGGSKNCWTETD